MAFMTMMMNGKNITTMRTRRATREPYSRTTLAMRGPPAGLGLACGLATIVAAAITEVLCQAGPGLDFDEHGRQDDDYDGHDRGYGRAVADVRLLEEVLVDVIGR